MIRTAAVVLLLATGMATAETVRVATFHTGLSSRGPGVLLNRLVKDDDPQIDAVVAMIAAVDPDILVLQDVDYDAGGATLTALADRLGAAGARYPERFALRPNAGMATGLDLDGDGLRGGPRDAQGYGDFAGDGGMAILSRHDILEAEVTDLSPLLWADLPGAIPPPLPDEVLEVQRLSSVGHWIVPVDIGGTVLTLLTWHATPPVFDGPEDRNGRRNRDEAAIWLRLLDGALGAPVPPAPFVLLGVGNTDPVRGEGRRDAIAALLDDDRLLPLAPQGAGGTATVAYDDPPGPLRVSFLLPSKGIEVLDAGVLWPDPQQAPDAFGPADTWPRHRIVWADLSFE